jgi:hypothetical protein
MISVKFVRCAKVVPELWPLKCLLGDMAKNNMHTAVHSGVPIIDLNEAQASS